MKLSTFNSQTLQQLRFHSVSECSDAGTRFFIKEGNAFTSFVWNALERILERVRNAFGTRLERVWNAFGTRSERVPNAFGTQMERERSVRLFLSSTVQIY